MREKRAILFRLIALSLAYLVCWGVALFHFVLLVNGDSTSDSLEMIGIALILSLAAMCGSVVAYHEYKRW